MIVVTDNLMVNPHNVAYIRKDNVSGGRFCVSLIALGTSGRIDIGYAYFQNEWEAERFMDYCCEEIDKANGVYQKTEELNEENIC